MRPTHFLNVSQATTETFSRGVMFATIIAYWYLKFGVQNYTVALFAFGAFFGVIWHVWFHVFALYLLYTLAQ